MPQVSATLLSPIGKQDKPAVITQFKEELAENATDAQRLILQQKFGIGVAVLTASEKLLIEREERRGTRNR